MAILDDALTDYDVLNQLKYSVHVYETLGSNCRHRDGDANLYLKKIFNKFISEEPDGTVE